MGRQKYLKKIEELFKKSPVVTYSSIKRIIKKSAYAKQFVHYLLSKNKIFRLTKGRYTTCDEASLAVFSFRPAYLGLQDAMSFHNLWEQETIPVIITTKKVRTGIRQVLGTNILVRRIEKKLYFGIEYCPQGSTVLPYSDIEKTFLDMVYFRQPLEGETVKNFLQKINRQKLMRYSRAYPKTVRKRILAFV